MIADLELFLRRIRNSISRSAWAVRHFRLSHPPSDGGMPGLVLIQVDGLSHAEMQRAMSNGRLPFLRSLVAKQTYRAHRLYSGLPSTTPAVQGELFYGVKSVVPAFCYYDAAGERIFSMFEGDDVLEIQRRLDARGEPLLRGGSAYADLFSGGAAEPHFCMFQLGEPGLFEGKSLRALALLLLLHLPSILRTVLLLVVELLLALVDCVRGVIARENLWLEIKFVPARVAVCILLREVTVMRAAVDLMRGLPVVHMNFLGYDEQSHRRGPDAAFAHWSLKGIDDAIKRIYHAAGRSLVRDYDVWIYSDHGQTRVKSYEAVHGETVQQAIARVFDRHIASGYNHRTGMQFRRARMLRIKRHRRETQPPDRLPIVTALGPLGHIYLGVNTSAEARERMAAALVNDAGIPLVIAAEGADTARAWTARGAFSLPRQAAEVLGEAHPFLERAAADLARLSHHPNAGNFLISGYAVNGQSLSFAAENGAHAGPSPRETEAFAFLPDDAPLQCLDHATPAIADLRAAAIAFLRGRPAVAIPPLPVPSSPRRALTVLTYNIHSCAGMDGQISPHRIARVIERERPDIIAIQEVDMGRARTARADQAALLARYLTMHHNFHPAIELEEERYGDAILSRFPMRRVHAGALPYKRNRFVDERRGALWVTIEIGGGACVQLVNTHLGLGRSERLQQTEALLGHEWLGHPDCVGPVILCGDFNSPSGSAVCRAIHRAGLRDVQEHLAGHKPLRTFSGRLPLHRIDHIFVSRHFIVREVYVPSTHLARVASDHLPLAVRLELIDPHPSNSEPPCTATAESQVG